MHDGIYHVRAESAKLGEARRKDVKRRQAALHALDPAVPLDESAADDGKPLQVLSWSPRLPALWCLEVLMKLLLSGFAVLVAVGCSSTKASDSDGASGGLAGSSGGPGAGTGGSSAAAGSTAGGTAGSGGSSGSGGVSGDGGASAGGGSAGTSGSAGSGGSAGAGGSWGGAGFVVDHTSIALFEQIPDEYVAAARNTKMMFSDRSVGVNINDALNCLTAQSWAQAPASCRRDYYDDDWNWKTFVQADRDAGLVPTRILFDPDPVKYDRSNWVFEVKSGSFSELTQDFIEVLAPSYVSTHKVLSYQFSYLNVGETDTIASPTAGFFVDSAARYDVYDLEAYIAEHPDNVFFFWTSSLARSIGTQVSTDFNDQMRTYARDNGKVLFDFADITSRTHTGAPCFDNRDGVSYCTMNDVCENYPDDGLALPAICQDYTTEVDGGHLGSVSGGGIRAAKAFWVLMARLAGWVPPS
jgi:hypothetical protein